MAAALCIFATLGSLWALAALSLAADATAIASTVFHSKQIAILPGELVTVFNDLAWADS
jgi:hypothetical protein